jgi:hypothetical protein
LAVWSESPGKISLWIHASTRAHRSSLLKTRVLKLGLETLAMGLEALLPLMGKATPIKARHSPTEKLPGRAMPEKLR